MEMSARKPLLPRRVLDLPIDALRPNPNQPRIEFDEASLRSLGPVKIYAQIYLQAPAE